MPIGSASSAVAAMQEKMWDTVEELVMLQGVLFKRIEKSTEVTAISNRPARIGFEVSTGGIFRTGANLFDNAGMGRGSAPILAYGNLSAVSFLQATEYTALAEYATDSTEKAVENFVTLTNRQRSETIAGYFDSLIANSDGSNLLDTVVSTSGTTGLVVSNANAFQDNQPIDAWTNYSDSAGTLVGTFTVQSVDIANNTIWLTGSFGACTTGTMLFVTGSSAATNGGLFGIPYYHVSGNAGNFMGIPRSSYAGKFSTPSVTPGTSTAPTGPITPANVRAMLAQIDLAMGIDASDDEVILHCNVDVAAAWENNSLAVQSIILNQVKGDEMPDALKRRQVSTAAGREIVRNVRAKTGRLDALNLKHWFRMETKAIGPYEVGGQTVFPTYDGSTGGLNSTMLSYITAMFQIGLGQPRREAYMPSISIPKGYFGQ